MGKRNEISFDPSQFPQQHLRREAGRSRAKSSWEALMECAPGEYPLQTSSEGQALRERIQDAIDRLEPVERTVFDAVVIERATLRALAKELKMSKNAVARIRDKAIAKLQADLLESDEVKEYLSD
jgi:RNA polymerase sigma factor (sigma-70 family)